MRQGGTSKQAVPPARPTRAEAQAATRARLLDAAEDLFAREGFAGASLDRIAEAAGHTRGAVYSNFSGKDDLFVAVLERRLERRAEQVAAAMDQGGDPAGFFEVLRSPEWRDDRPGVQRWALLNDEFRLYALRNPEVRPVLARFERRLREEYAAGIEHLLAQVGLELPTEPWLAAAIVYALDTNLGRQHVIDPEGVAADAFTQAMELLVRAAEALARTR